MNSKTQGIVLALLATLFFSTTAVFSKLLMADVSPLIVALLTQAVSMLVIFLIWGTVPEWHKIERLTRRDTLMLVLVALLAAVIGPLLLYAGVKQTTATNTVLISRLEPVFINLIAAFWLKESLSRRQWLGIATLALGAYLIATRGHLLPAGINPGDLMVALFALCVGVATLLFKRYLTHLAPDLIVLGRNGIGAITLFIITLTTGHIGELEVLLNPDVAMLVLVFAAIPIIAAQLSWYRSLELIPASLTSSINMSSAIFGVAWAALLLGERFDTIHLVGGGLTVLGLLFLLPSKQNHNSLRFWQYLHTHWPFHLPHHRHLPPRKQRAMAEKMNPL